MNIVVDAQLPHAAERFAELGRVEPVCASDLNARMLRDADVLIVRSVTRVDRALLDGTRVRFVGSATSGTDHVDLDYLRTAGIAFADAPGCNATAVAEYVVAAILELQSRLVLLLPGASIGIVGCGHVGRKVARYAAALGLRVVLNDPPLARENPDPRYRPLAEVLACDIVSVHVPLNRIGPNATYHLVDNDFLGALKRGTVLINTARGAVVDSAALKTKIRSRGIPAVLDVWENEPLIDQELLELAAIGTPHIAGHTLDAKWRAVDMLYGAALKHFGRPVTPHVAPEAVDPVHRVEIDAAMSANALSLATRTGFNLADVSARFRKTLRADEASRAAGFEALRSAHPARREFSATEVVIDANHADANALETLGFRVIRRTAMSAAGGRA